MRCSARKARSERSATQADIDLEALAMGPNLEELKRIFAVIAAIDVPEVYARCPPGALGHQSDIISCHLREDQARPTLTARGAVAPGGR